MKICLVGRGSIGTRHVKNLHFLSQKEIVSYSATIDKEKDIEFQSKYQIKTYHNIQEIYDYQPDLFVIANPTSKHLEIAEYAINMKSHIFMEKPLSNTILGVNELVKKINANSLVFMLANNLRFHPAFIEIKRLIDEGIFGKIYFARIMVGQYLPDWHPWENYRNGYSAQKKLGGGVVLTLQHEIDYAYWFFGKFKIIKAFVKKISNLEIDVEDIASIIIETVKGSLIEIHLDYLQRPSKRTIQIQGSKGSIDYCFGDRFLKFFQFKEKKNRKIIDLKGYNVNQMYIDEMKYFLECVQNNKIPKSNFDDAEYVLKTCMKIKGEI